MKTSLLITILFISFISILSVEYYPACSSSYVSLVEALKSIGVDSSYNNRKNIAALNGISNYSGTAEQNTKLLNLLKKGRLIKSNSGEDDPTPSTEYYPACSSSYVSLVEALKSIGVDSSYDNRKRIAAVNGISNYSGTAGQNTQLLNLLKRGRLIKSKSGGDDPTPTPTPSTEYYPACSSSYVSLVEALKSIGVDSSYDNRKRIAAVNGISNYSGTAGQNTQLLNLLKRGRLIKSKSGGDDPTPTPTPTDIDTDTPSPTPTPTPTPSSLMISKVANSAKFSSKRDTIKIIGNLLVNNDYPASFIAGILANIFHEADIGRFENSVYISRPEPKYLIYMDKLYDYRNKYSNKIITEVSMNALSKILEELKKNKWLKGKFGLGCVQWTGSRTYDLFQIYQQECGYADKISSSQAISAEGKMVISELRGSYIGVYNKWKSENVNKNTAQAAYNAGYIICMEYEMPTEKKKKALIRGDTAREMYNIMTS